MAHYVRFLTPSSRVLSVAVLKKVLLNESCKATITVESGSSKEWNQLVVANPKGDELVAIERNPVAPGSLGAAELQEFLNEIEGEKPECGVAWLRTYLPEVKAIYAFQILKCFDVPNGEKPFYAILEAFRSKLKGIIQGDREGFTNEQGDQVVWQFTSSAKGPWSVALYRDGDWVRFEVELSNRRHRDAFLRGEIPKGIKPL